MENITKKQALELCIQMWDELVTHPKRKKRETQAYKKHADEVLNKCFACEYALQQAYQHNEKNPTYGDTFCKYCPVWDYNGTSFLCEGAVEVESDSGDTVTIYNGAYGKWNDAYDNEECIKYATEIREMTVAKLAELKDDSP